MRTSSPSSKYSCESVSVNSVSRVGGFPVFFNSSFDISSPVLDAKTVVIDSGFHGEESLKLRKVLLLHFLYHEVLLLFIVDGSYELIDVVLLFVTVNIVIVRIPFDINFLYQSIFTQQLLLEFSKEPIIRRSKSMNVFIIIGKWNFLPDHSYVRASIKARLFFRLYELAISVSSDVRYSLFFDTDG